MAYDVLVISEALFPGFDYCCRGWSAARPGSVNPYTVYINGIFARMPPVATIRTLPGPGEVVRIALGSCQHRYGLGNPRMLELMISRNVHALVNLGDIAAQDRRDNVGLIRADYLLRDFMPAWQLLSANVPQYSNWYDHDYFGQDGGGIPEGYTEGDRDGIRRVFVESWSNPGYGNENEGLYFSTRIGPADIIVTDNRFFREDRKGSFLGDNQMAWLKKRLQGSSAPFVILTSGGMSRDHMAAVSLATGETTDWEPGDFLEGRRRGVLHSLDRLPAERGPTMSLTERTVLYHRHLSERAKMVDFAGFEMPLQYEAGIVREHLATRKGAGLFDVSHMGRFVFGGTDALDFLQHVLTNNAAALDVGEAQYTMIPAEDGGVVDDAYLFRFVEDSYLLVVNAANREKAWKHFQGYRQRYPLAEMKDHTADTAMISLQGPESRNVLLRMISAGQLPEPMRNALSEVELGGVKVQLARTGYTGEPIGFELFVASEYAEALWEKLAGDTAVQPVGLGARDTLRLEAGLPLYGHEMGPDEGGGVIPAFAPGVGRFAISFSALKGDFVGREALMRQFEAFRKILDRDLSALEDLPRRVLPLALTEKGVAREGCRVFRGSREVGRITSGTMVPFWKFSGEGIGSTITGETGRRAIALALVDSDLFEGDVVEVDIRGRKTAAVLVPYHLRSEAPPFARAILHERLGKPSSEPPVGGGEQPVPAKVTALIRKAVDNSLWRGRQCINLIPSEQSPSTAVRLMSVLDPLCRYAEHKPVKAFEDTEVFYYQGTGFIAEVERLLRNELVAFLGCAEVELRAVSGQMANAAVFSAMVDYLNRADRKSEQRRIRKVFNHHIIKGGHLSAQPMGALRDFVARDPVTERPAVVNFPVLEHNPYRIDVAACRDLLEQHRPELIIFGKSMTLYREPVSEVRAVVEELGLDCVILYDMAHVLGLVGPHFQQPFAEGADLVTGSTHKTFFGTQRGIVAGNWSEEDRGWELWEAVARRAFPGSVSNHHLGTLLGLLLTSYEMNCFRDAYQKQVLSNARAFARALKDCGFHVAGDPELGYTETHQVIVTVGYARGPEVAQRLEESNIIVNYQATPDEEGFTASGALRMGVAEMTRFGMEEADFQRLASLIRDVVQDRKHARKEVSDFRKAFLDMRFCFSGEEFRRLLAEVRSLV